MAMSVGASAGVTASGMDAAASYMCHCYVVGMSAAAVVVPGHAGQAGWL